MISIAPHFCIVAKPFKCVFYMNYVIAFLRMLPLRLTILKIKFLPKANNPTYLLPQSHLKLIFCLLSPPISAFLLLSNALEIQLYWLSSMSWEMFLVLFLVSFVHKLNWYLHLQTRRLYQTSLFPASWKAWKWQGLVLIPVWPQFSVEMMYRYSPQTGYTVCTLLRYLPKLVSVIHVTCLTYVDHLSFLKTEQQYDLRL